MSSLLRRDPPRSPPRLLVLAAVAVLVGCPACRRSDGEPAEQSAESFTCPMHAEVRAEQAGDCPICTMSLVPASAARKAEDTQVRLTEHQVRLAGVRTAPAQPRELFRELLVPGTILPDERRVAVVECPSGRIDRLFVDTTGAPVTKDDPLLELYDPQLITDQEALAVATENLEKLRARDPGAVAQAALEHARRAQEIAREELEWWGLTGEQLDEIERTRVAHSRFTLRAPIDGTVLEKGVEAGMYVRAGQVLYRLADLCAVWCVAELSETDLAVLEGARALGPVAAEVTVAALPGSSQSGVVEFVEPLLRAGSRTVKVRIPLDNAAGSLRPGMYARARLRAGLGAVLCVPAPAVLWTGQRTIVLVERAAGAYEPVEVVLGSRWLSAAGGAPAARARPYLDDGERYHEVVSGLAPGARVVTSGNFLIASEARLRGALTNLAEPPGPAANSRIDGPAPAPARPGLRRAIDRYFAAEEALAGGQGELARARAAEAAEAAVGTGWVPAEELARGAETVSAASPGEELAASFAAWTAALRRVLAADAELVGEALGEGASVHRYFCPMANREWLQRSPAPGNPYLPEMPACRVERAR